MTLREDRGHEEIYTYRIWDLQCGETTNAFGT
jgi:hypothetical protein